MRAILFIILLATLLLSIFPLSISLSHLAKPSKLRDNFIKPRNYTKLALSKTDGICLYGIQAFPYGFQKTLEVILKSRGVDYDQQAFLQWTTLPWTLKPLFASLFENSGLSSLRNVLFVLSGLQAAIGMLIYNTKKTFPLGVALFTAAIATASYDIILDSLMIKRRRQESIEDMDTANTEQAVGFKIGSMLSGSLVLFLVSNISKSSSTADSLFCVSPIISALFTLIYAYKLSNYSVLKSENANIVTHKPPGNNFYTTFRVITNDIRENYLFYLLILVHKAGESMGDVLMTQYLGDEQHMKRPKFAAMKLINDLIAIAGFMLPAFLPRRRFSEAYSLKTLLAINIIPQVFRALIVFSNVWRSVPRMIGITSLEYFVGSAVTVAMSNYIFSNVIEGVEGSHYSFIASLEEFGKMIFKYLALKMLSLGFKFQELFLFALVLSFVPVVLVHKSLRKLKIKSE